MKKFIFMFVAMIGVGSLSVAGFAHEGTPAEKNADVPAGHDEMGPRMGKWLDLKPEQAEKFKSAMKTHHADMKPRFDAERDALEKLHELIKAKADDGAVQASLTKLRSAQKDVADSENNFFDSLSFLNATQRAKLVLAHALMAHHGSMSQEMKVGGRHRHGPEGEKRSDAKAKGGAPAEDGDDD